MQVLNCCRWHRSIQINWLKGYSRFHSICSLTTASNDIKHRQIMVLSWSEISTIIDMADWSLAEGKTSNPTNCQTQEYNWFYFITSVWPVSWWRRKGATSYGAQQNPRSIWRSNWFLWSFFGLFIRLKKRFIPHCIIIIPVNVTCFVRTVAPGIPVPLLRRLLKGVFQNLSCWTSQRGLTWSSITAVSRDVFDVIF